MRITRTTFLSGLVLLVGTLVQAAPLDPATQKIYQKIDSLFVIASSGELKYRDQVDPAIEAIAKLGAPAVPHLIEKLANKSARDRLTIISIFTKIGSAAVPGLTDALGRPDWLVVQRICWALGDIKDSAAVGPLKQVAHHPNWQVREYSIRALGNIGNLKGLPTVISAFNDSLGPVRKAAAFASGEIKDASAIPMLVRTLGDDFYGARFDALEALMFFDTNEVITCLRDSLPDASNLKANLICQALGKIGNGDAMNILNAELDSDKPERRTFAAVALVAADPNDLCGFQNKIYKRVTDRLDLVEIESAKMAAQYARQKSQ